MSTIQYIDKSGVTRNITSYLNKQDAESNLLAWQYVCSRLYKVSNQVPIEFKFIEPLKNDSSIQSNLYNIFKDSEQSKKIDISDFSNSKAVDIIKSTQIVPNVFEKDYLLLDLLLAQRVLLEKGDANLNDYGKKIILLAQEVSNKNMKEVVIDIDLIDEIIESERNKIQNRNLQLKQTQGKLDESQRLIQEYKRDIENIEKKQELGKIDSTYISDFNEYSEFNINILKKNRVFKEKSMNILDKIKLGVFKILNKDTESLYGDNLVKLEKELEKAIVKNYQEFHEKNDQFNLDKKRLQRSILKEENNIEELNIALKSIKEIDSILAINDQIDGNYVRDVKRVNESVNCVFLHSIGGINAFHPYENSPINPRTSFSDKVNQIRCFRPSISCSSFKLDSNSEIRDFTAPMGVIINGGHIVSASTCDHGTSPNADGNRKSHNLSTSQIKKIIDSRVQTYDEFVISNSQVAGLYINVDRIMFESINDRRYDYFPKIIEEVISYKKEHGDIPIFIIKDKNLYEVDPKINISGNIQEFNHNVNDSKKNFKNFNISALNEKLLNSCFYILKKKSANDLSSIEVEFSNEEKFNLAQGLVKNYKPEYQEMINGKIKALQANIADMRDKFSDNSKENNPIKPR